jgi:hypothetical protein
VNGRALISFPQTPPSSYLIISVTLSGIKENIGCAARGGLFVAERSNPFPHTEVALKALLTMGIGLLARPEC